MDPVAPKMTIFCCCRPCVVLCLFFVSVHVFLFLLIMNEVAQCMHAILLWASTQSILP